MTEIKFELPNMLQGKELCMLRQRYPLILQCLTSSTTYPILAKSSLIYCLENYEYSLLFGDIKVITGKLVEK